MNRLGIIGEGKSRMQMANPVSLGYLGFKTVRVCVLRVCIFVIASK